jgi:O-antigen/teichoic acid export membrane protein
MSRSKRAFYGLFTGLVGFGIQMALQIVIVPFVIKIAGRDTLGAYSIIMQIIGYGLLFDLGFSASLGRFLSHSLATDDNGIKFNKTYNIGRTFLLFINIIIGILICVTSLFISDIIPAKSNTLYDMRVSMILLGVWTILKTPFTLNSIALNSSQNMSIVNIVTIFGGLTRFILSLIFVYLGMGLIGLVGAFIISEMISILFNRYFFLLKFKNFKFQWIISDKELLKEILNFGLKYWGVNLAVVIYYSTDIIIVGHLFGAASASIYYVTKTPSFFAYQFIYRLSDNTGPGINELYAKSEFNAIKETYMKVLKYSLILAFPLALGIICFNKYIISIWTSEGQYGGDLMTYSIAFYVIIEVINHVNAMILVVSGKMKWWAKISFIQSVLGIILAFTFGKLIGLGGVMLGLLISSVPMFFFLIYRTLPIIDLNFKTFYIKILKPTTISIIPLIFFMILIKTNFLFFIDYLNNFFQIIVFLNIWLLSSYYFAINKEDKLWFYSLLGKFQK